MSLTDHARDCLGSLVSRLVLLRQQEGPRPGWESVDRALCAILDTTVEIGPLKEHYKAVLEAVRTETWGEAGKDTRVGTCEVTS